MKEYDPERISAPPPNPKVYKPGAVNYSQDILKNRPSSNWNEEKVCEWLEKFDDGRFSRLCDLRFNGKELQSLSIKRIQRHFISLNYNLESARALSFEFYHLIHASKIKVKEIKTIPQYNIFSPPFFTFISAILLFSSMCNDECSKLSSYPSYKVKKKNT